MAKVLTRKRTVEDQLDQLRQLLLFDKKHKYRGRSKKPQCYLVGTDEVGRGCLAGPVVAAAVMLPDIADNSEIAVALSDLNDSKMVTPPQRERLSKLLHEIAICEIAQASPAEINEINILQASLLAMKRATHKLVMRIPTRLPVLVLVDGNQTIKGLDHSQTTVIQGDSSSASIAAASIIAKVFRDALMTDLSAKFPEYNWQQNKGYGSSSHRAALRQLGMTSHHRTLFCRRHLTGETELEEFMEDLIDEVELN